MHDSNIMDRQVLLSSHFSEIDMIDWNNPDKEELDDLTRRCLTHNQDILDTFFDILKMDVHDREFMTNLMGFAFNLIRERPDNHNAVDLLVFIFGIASIIKRRGWILEPDEYGFGKIHGI